MLSIDEAIAQEREIAKEQKTKYDICPTRMRYCCEMCFHNPKCNEVAEYHEQLAEWLEELKALRKYKERMEMQYLDDIDNPLEPLKLQSALQSEIFKFNYRKEHKPQDINILDYTVMSALKYCLEEQLKEGKKMKRMEKENVMALLAEYAEKHPLAAEFGSEYIMQDDKAQEDALELVCNIFDSMEMR